MKRYSADELNNMSKEDLVKLLMENQEQLSLFQDRLALLEHDKFGRKTERLQCLDQMSIFNEAEAEQDPDAEEPTVEEVVVHRRKKEKGFREEQLKNLETEVCNHYLSEEELTEIFGENGWISLPDDTYKTLECIPAQYKVNEHHIGVYRSKKDHSHIVRAPHPQELFRGSIATASLVSAVANGKYTNAMPLYRISQELERNDVKIPRRNLANWIIWAAERYLSLLYDRMHELLCSEYHVLQADETMVKVSKDGRSAGSQSRMFVYRTGQFYKDRIIILYDYRLTRGHEHVEDFLKEFHGVVETDAFSGYFAWEKERKDIKIATCWVHARRDFADAVKIMNKNGTPKKAIRRSVANMALNKMKTIFELEGTLADMSPEERLAARKKIVEPEVDAYFSWVKEQNLNSITSAKTREGLQYSLNQEEHLRRFLEDGEIPIDNSASERAIRPFTVGRANWHIIDTIHGAQASAIMYSLVETAKANELKIYEYLKYLLTEIPKHMEDTDRGFLDDLLPWSASLPDSCKKTIKTPK